MNTLNNNHQELTEDIEEIFEDALNGDQKYPAKERKKPRRKKIMNVNFTSEVFQTLFEDEATVSLPRETNGTSEKVYFRHASMFIKSSSFG